MLKPKVKIGQTWIKKKDGAKLLIHKKRGDFWFALSTNGESHKMRAFDLYKFWLLRIEPLKIKDIPLSTEAV